MYTSRFTDVFRRMSNSKGLDQVTSCSNLFVLGPARMQAPHHPHSAKQAFCRRFGALSLVPQLWKPCSLAWSQPRTGGSQGPCVVSVFSRLSPPDTESAELRKPRGFFFWDSQTEAEVHHIWADAIETKVKMWNRQGGLLFFFEKKLFWNLQKEKKKQKAST